MLTIAVCTHADSAERASMVSIRTVVIVILDSRRRTSTEMSYAKTLTIVVLVRLFKHWRQDASDNPTRFINVERLVLNVFDGDSGHRFLRTHRGEERFPGMTITLALIQTVGKIAERSSPKFV